MADMLHYLRQRINDTTDCVVTLDSAGRPVYDERIQWGRDTQDSGGDEELVRALWVIHLVHGLGYRPESIILEHKITVKVGRNPKVAYPDIAVRRNDSRASIWAMIELKTSDSFSEERDSAWESQLFGLVPHIEWGPEILAYATAELPYKEGDEPVFKAEVVDLKEYSSFEDWVNSAKETLTYVPENYGAPLKRIYRRGSTTSEYQELRGNLSTGEMEKIRTQLHNILWGGGTQTDTDIFNLLVRLIAAKIQDERSTNQGEIYKFQIKKDETLEEVLSRIDMLYRECLERRLNVEHSDAKSRKVWDGEKGTKAQIMAAIDKLEEYNFEQIMRSDPDVLGDFFEKIMRKGVKQTKGQFFTHPNIVDFVVSILELDEWAVRNAKQGLEPPKIIDPSAGSATFLVQAMLKMTYSLRRLHEKEGISLSSDAITALIPIVSSEPRHHWAGGHCYGLETNTDLGLAAQVNMMLHADGSSAVYSGPNNGNGLAHFGTYPISSLLNNSHLHPIYGYPVCEEFDAVLTNPPFSLTYSQEEINELHKSFKISKSSKPSSEFLFLQRWFHLLKEGGKIGAVVPESMLSGLQAGKEGGSRDFLIRNFKVRAIISLPVDAFAPYTQTKTSLLFAEKRSRDDLERTKKCDNFAEIFENDPEIVFAEAKHIGYKRRNRGEMQLNRNDLTLLKDEIGRKGIWN